MTYKEIEDVFSEKRMQKYVQSCGGDTRRAMTLYRYNLKLSQEMFTLISCFEVALRNRIDRQMIARWGNDWLRDLVMPGGNFYNQHSVEKTKKIITNAYKELQSSDNYSHSKLLASMEFGVWKYLYSNSAKRKKFKYFLGDYYEWFFSFFTKYLDYIFNTCYYIWSRYSWILCR